MEKSQLINFIAKVMEESGFKVYKNFKTSIKVIDIYAILPTTMGDFGMVIECNNYDRQWEVGVDILKEMELVGENLNSSKITITTTSTFSAQAKNYASKKNIKLVDRDGLLNLAKKFSKNNLETNENVYSEEEYPQINDNQYYSDYEDQNRYEYAENEYYGDYYHDETYSHNDDIYSQNYLQKLDSRQNNNPLSNLFSKNNNKRYDLMVPVNNSIYKVPLSERLKPLLNNTIFLVILIVIVSFLIAFVSGVVFKISPGITGLIELILSLILSYILVAIFNRDIYVILIKGTVIFFISLIILIILTLFL